MPFLLFLLIVIEHFLWFFHENSVSLSDKNLKTTSHMEQHPQLLVYKASAGSGKTFTLAVHYIRQLIEDPYAYRRILAVTFTNKATAEMKERILEQLYGIATADEGSDGYLKEIQKTSAKSVGEIREAAREALRHMIHDYSRFRIETIDSFSSR